MQKCPRIECDPGAFLGIQAILLLHLAGQKNFKWLWRVRHQHICHFSMPSAQMPAIVACFPIARLMPEKIKV